MKEHALEDAQETFLDEQLAYWYDQAEPPKPQRAWLKERLNRKPTDNEFDAYAHAYRGYLLRAMRKLEAVWDSYVERVEVDYNADGDCYAECLDAMKGKDQ